MPSSEWVKKKKAETICSTWYVPGDKENMKLLPFKPLTSTWMILCEMASVTPLLAPEGHSEMQSEL